MNALEFRQEPGKNKDTNVVSPHFHFALSELIGLLHPNQLGISSSSLVQSGKGESCARGYFWGKTRGKSIT